MTCTLAALSMKGDFMKNGMSLVWAFLFAGCVGLLGEILNTVLGAVFSSGPAEIAVVLTLLLMGVVGMILVLCGVYQKIEDKAEMGIMGTFVGFVPAAANMFMGLKKETGKSGAAFGKTMGGLCLMILVGCVIALVISAIFWFVA